MYALSRLNGLSSDGAGRLIVVMWEESSMVPYLALLLSALLAVADQLLKLLVKTELAPIGDIPLIKDVLHLTYVENRGMAFGMMQGQKWLLIWVTALVLLVLIAGIIMGLSLIHIFGSCKTV